MNLDHRSDEVHPCLKLPLAFLRLEIFPLLRIGVGKIGPFYLCFTKMTKFWLVTTIFSHNYSKQIISVDAEYVKSSTKIYNHHNMLVSLREPSYSTSTVLVDR